MKRKHYLLPAVLAAVLGSVFAPLDKTQAAEYPERPIKLVVPNGAGGSTDITARLVAGVFNEKLGADLAIVNMPGGGTSIGATSVAESPADGYTLLFTHEALLTSSAMGANRLGPASLTPIAQVAKEVIVLAVRKDSPITSLQGFYDAAAKGHAGDKLKLGINPGAANHFFLLNALAPVEHDVIFVPTGGGAKTLKSLLGGHIDASAFAVSESIEAIRGGEVVPLAVFNTERHLDLPDVPTASESGYDLNIGLHYVSYAPAGTPADIVAKLADAMSATLAEDSFQQTLIERSITPALITGAELGTTLDERYATIQALANKYILGK